LTPLGRFHVSSSDTEADVTFRTAWRDAVPLNDGQSLVGPGIYRIVLVRSHHTQSMVRTPVQTNHMCDCPNRLHIDVVGTALFPTKIYV